MLAGTIKDRDSCSLDFYIARVINTIGEIESAEITNPEVENTEIKNSDIESAGVTNLYWLMFFSLSLLGRIKCRTYKALSMKLAKITVPVG